jgi:hypothetical protein
MMRKRIEKMRCMMLEGIGYNIFETPDRKIGIASYRKGRKKKATATISSITLFWLIAKA